MSRVAHLSNISQFNKVRTTIILVTESPVDYPAGFHYFTSDRYQDHAITILSKETGKIIII